MVAGGEERRADLTQTLERMLREAKRAGEVVRRLRDFFRSGEARPETASVFTLLEDMRVAFSEQVLAGGATVVVSSEPGLPDFEFDRLQLEVVLRNLIHNALDSVANPGVQTKRIQIGAAREGRERIRLTVIDSGSGISPSPLRSVFEPFVTTKAQGMGLGLPISRAIVEAHGGALVAETGKHGVFRTNIPITQAHEHRDLLSADSLHHR